MSENERVWGGRGVHFFDDVPVLTSLLSENSLCSLSYKALWYMLREEARYERNGSANVVEYKIFYVSGHGATHHELDREISI